MVEVVALVISTAALLVSGAALYVASLRPAEIVVDVVEDLSGPRLAGPWFGGFPPVEFPIAVSIWNSGARGGVLQGLGAFNLKPTGPWKAVSTIGSYNAANVNTPAIVFPQALEAGDVRIAFLMLDLKTSDFARIEDYAQSLSGLNEIEVEISWSFLRSSGLPRHLRRRRELRTPKAQRVSVSAGEWRDAVLESWASNPQTANLTTLAGVPPEASTGLRREVN